MKNIQNIKIKSHSTIKEALKIIDSGAKRIAVVIDKQNKLIGTLTDGDIRRGLLSGLTLESTIEAIYFRNPTLAHINDSKEEIIKKAILKQIYQIPIIDDEGHFVDIVDLAALINVTNRRNKVILMVGGLGTRLRPLTENTPKPMLKVGDKPILETIIENFAKYGFTNITLSVNYKSNIIKNYFGDGSEFGVNIDYIEEEKRLGTAGALSLLRDKPNEPFFVMNGDLLTNVNFEHLLDFHMHQNSLATMCVREYEQQVPFGVVNINDGKITSIQEKPINKFFVSAGIYLLSPEVLNLIPQNEFYDMPTLFEQLIMKNKNVISFPLREYWIDIGRIEEYEKANTEYDEVFYV